MFKGLPQFSESLRKSNTATEAVTDAETPAVGSVREGTATETPAETPIATHSPL